MTWQGGDYLRALHMVLVGIFELCINILCGWMGGAPRVEHGDLAPRHKVRISAADGIDLLVD